MLAALSAVDADYLVVGAHALAAHGVPRATGDLDLWVRPTRENAERVWRALEKFGAPLHELTVEDLCRPGVVFQIGVVPRRIDLLTSITGVSFEEAWENRTAVEIEDIEVPVIFASADAGELRPHVLLLHNDRITRGLSRRDVPLAAGDRLEIVQAVNGG